jgi:hypothetical protein
MLDLWDERAAGTPGEGAPVGVQFTPMHLPNRRIRDPYVRWCGRGEAARPLPIPIRWHKEGQMNKQLCFTSSFFEVQPGEDEETNPGLYGKALAHWVGEQLEQRGVSVEGVIPEDFGWVVMVARQPFMLWVGCSSEDGSKSRWRMFVAAEPSLWQRLFKKIETQPAVANLESHLAEIAKNIPDIQEVAWE